jgi:putative transposase
MSNLDKRQDTLKAVLDYFYQDNTKSGSHSRYNLKYHLVWITKYRRSFLVGEIAERLQCILTEIAREYGFNIIVQEVMPDHVHMLIRKPLISDVGLPIWVKSQPGSGRS